MIPYEFRWDRRLELGGFTWIFMIDLGYELLIFFIQQIVVLRINGESFFFPLTTS